MKIHNIIEELNKENGTNYKLDVLKKHKDNKLLQEVLKMTYDTVTYTYGMSLKHLNDFSPAKLPYQLRFDQALYTLKEKISNRERTGHAALQLVSNLIGNLPQQDAELVRKIINRDLRINVGKTQINKVWKGLIEKTVYMRCGVYSEKTAKKISYPACLELKADGTYREFTVQNGHVTSRSRSGESYEYPVIFEQMKDFSDGIYIGELTVKNITDRAKGNGLINSLEPPHEDIILQLWDYVTLDEYENARNKVKNKTTYRDRFNAILALPYLDNVEPIEWREVNNIQEALEHTSKIMNDGFEGTILKDWNNVFRDGTSPQQLKLKLEIDCEMRITGFHEGRAGTKREGKIGSIEFENDEGTIKGRCSGFSDKQLDNFTARQDELLGKIITVQFNDLSKAEGNEYYALGHPRFIEIRNDKDQTDSLETVLKLRDMAMQLG